MVSTTILLNSGVYRLFGTPFSIAKHPHLLNSISYCLTNGVLFTVRRAEGFSLPSIHSHTAPVLQLSQSHCGARLPRRPYQRRNAPPAGGPASRGLRRCRRVHPPDRTAPPPGCTSSHSMSMQLACCSMAPPPPARLNKAA